MGTESEVRSRSHVRWGTVALIAAFTLALTSTPSAFGAGPGWTFLGRTQASYKRDHDAIVVRGRGDNYRALKFKVTDAPLNLREVLVTYDNNTKERLPARENIPRGGESRPIDLRGGKRSIRRIEFWYDTKGMGKGRADVTVYGRH